MQKNFASFFDFISIKMKV